MNKKLLQFSSRTTNGQYDSLCKKKREGKKAIAILVDPDKSDDAQLIRVAHLARNAQVDFLFVGGSLLLCGRMDHCINTLKAHSDIPVIIFPGSPAQISVYADALLYLSVISSRNPELLIGQHVGSAAIVHRSGLEVIPTGYMIIDGGVPTSVSYMSNSFPIPHDKRDIATATAMAGAMLGLKLIFMDAGSGAQRPVHTDMIRQVSTAVSIPLLVGGGIQTPEAARQQCIAGADVIVVGNAIETDCNLISEITAAVHSISTLDEKFKSTNTLPSLTDFK